MTDKCPVCHLLTEDIAGHREAHMTNPVTPPPAGDVEPPTVFAWLIEAQGPRYEDASRTGFTPDAHFAHRYESREEAEDQIRYRGYTATAVEHGFIPAAAVVREPDLIGRLFSDRPITGQELRERADTAAVDERSVTEPVTAAGRALLDDWRNDGPTYNFRIRILAIEAEAAERERNAAARVEQLEAALRDLLDPPPSDDAWWVRDAVQYACGLIGRLAVEPSWKKVLRATQRRYVSIGTAEDGPCWCVMEPYNHDEPQCSDARAALTPSTDSAESEPSHD